MINKEDLNDAQWAAVEYCDGPSLVIAGAGSGKTRVLTYKIAYLLEHGYEPWSILALTFTNKAAHEMQERIARQVGEDLASGLWMGTFHSIFSRILRIESQWVGVTSNFTIYDTDDSKSLLHTIVREMGLDDKQYKSSLVLSRISAAKNALMLPSDYERNPNIHRRDEAQSMSQLPQIYHRYQERCRQANAMDFDDLLLYTWMLFRDHEEVRQKYQQRFRFVLVDEYQDTNFAQHQIVWQLTRERQRLCVVGDDAQSIYSFRGANIDNILNFQQQYPSAKLFKLEQNYRSTQNIVSAANSLIHHNARQIHKDVFSQNNIGTPIQLNRTYSDSDEAQSVIRSVQRYVRDSHIPYSKMAILYRINKQSHSFEDVLRKNRLPYRIYGGTPFYQRKEVKDLIAYFRLVVNPADEEALKRIINYPTRGIGQTTLGKLLAEANERHTSVWEVLDNLPKNDFNKTTQARLASFRQLIQSFHEESTQTDAHTLALRIARETGVRDEIMKGNEPEDISHQQNLQELLDGISAFVQEHIEQGSGTLLTHYLQEVSLLSDLDQDASESTDKLTLMTIHSAKGLEFDVVFVVGLEENLFPSEMAQENPRQIEEERRLLYVAMTRARLHLHLSYARSRFLYGKMEFSRPSRFLNEIDPRYLKSNVSTQQTPTPPPTIMSRPSFAPKPSAAAQSPVQRQSLVRIGKPAQSQAAQPTFTPNAAIKIGAKVVHDRFGQGVVERIEGQGIDTKATVNFRNAGTKILLLRFARLTVIGE